MEFFVSVPERSTLIAACLVAQQPTQSLSTPGTPAVRAKNDGCRDALLVQSPGAGIGEVKK